MKITNQLKQKKKIKSVGPWSVGQKLAGCATGGIYETLNVETKQNGALKVIIRENNEISKRADMERLIVKKLKHPNIVTCYEAITVNDFTFLMMELAESDLLQYLWKRGSMNEKETKESIKCLIEAVSYCHQHGVAHRDIKLENILICQGKLKLADFGLSTIFQQQSFQQQSIQQLSIIDLENKNLIKKEWMCNTFCGSLHYAAPELFEGKPYNPMMVDSWAIGVCLYCMVTGTMPFLHNGNGDRKSILLAITSGHYNKELLRINNCSLELIELLGNLLKVNPKERLKVESILEQSWFQKNNDNHTILHSISTSTINLEDKLEEFNNNNNHRKQQYATFNHHDEFSTVKEVTKVKEEKEKEEETWKEIEDDKEKSILAPLPVVVKGGSKSKEDDSSAKSDSKNQNSNEVGYRKKKDKIILPLPFLKQDSGDIHCQTPTFKNNINIKEVFKKDNNEARNSGSSFLSKKNDEKQKEKVASTNHSKKNNKVEEKKKKEDSVVSSSNQQKEKSLQKSPRVSLSKKEEKEEKEKEKEKDYHSQMSSSRLKQMKLKSFRKVVSKLLK